MAERFYPPKLDETSFNCPFCKAYSHMYWHTIYRNDRGYLTVSDTKIAICAHCEKFSIWFNRKMVYPASIEVPSPNEDLNENIKSDYNEAAEILQRSPRASAALLRLGLQKLCVQLGKPGKNIDDDIKSLVEDGLNPTIQQAMDILRVIGNNAVHPGQIDLKDDSDTARKLFDIVNLIAMDRITTPKQISSMYSTLPKGALEAIERRDKRLA